MGSDGNRSMKKLSRDDLWGLEQYARERDAFRRTVLAHKQHRRIALGPHATLLCEDFLTMKYQVQEMLRTERIFEPAEIQGELDTYNPLIPDGDNWKATLLIEFAEEGERKRMLTALRGAEHQVWMEVPGAARVYAIANEDMERSNADKTAAVHFMRFQLPAPVISAIKQGATIQMGIDHPVLDYTTTLNDASRNALAADLD